MKCEWKSCRKKATHEMQLGRIDGGALLYVFNVVRLCEKHTDVMGYTANFPRKEVR